MIKKGGFADNKSGEKQTKSFHAGTRSYGVKKTGGYSARKTDGDKKPYGERRDNDRPARSYSGSNSGTSRYNRDDRKPYGERRDNDRPARSYAGSNSGASRYNRDDKKPYGERRDNDRPTRSYAGSNSGTSRYNRDDRKPYGERRDNDRPARSYAGSGSGTSRYNRDDRKPYGERREGYTPSEGAENKRRTETFRFGDDKNRARGKSAFSRPAVSRRGDEFEEERALDELLDRKAIEAGFTAVVGRNPVKEALKNGRNITRLYIAPYEEDHVLYDIFKKAEAAAVFVTVTDRRKLDRMAGDENHQGVIAMCAPVEFKELADVLSENASSEKAPFFVLLNGLTDPHNVGAIIRSACLMGASALIIGKRRSALIGAGVYKASAGAVEYLPIVQVTNLAQAIETLKENNITVVGCDMDGEDYQSLDYTAGTCLVVGSEGEGLTPLVKKKCDSIASIPIDGSVDSLNASVAAGIMISEIASQRRKKQ